MGATSQTSDQELAAGLRLAVTRTARRLRQEAGGGLTPTLTAALSTIERHGPLTPSELAEREGIRRPTVTRLIRGLEADGFVERAAAAHDGRSSLISITRDGKALLRSVRTRKDAFLAQRLGALTPADRRTLERAASLLEGILEA
jgi:DNA-binding MarR family transcriptional regulator